MKTLLAIAIVGLAASASAETLSSPSFRIEIPDGWTHKIERGPQGHSEFGELINIYQPDGNGVLKIQSYSAPKVVDRQILRNMTNVDLSVPLDWQKWGDNSGFQYDYSERSSFRKQWWLANDRTLIFIVYESNAGSSDIEIEEIDRIVTSITVNRS